MLKRILTLLAMLLLCATFPTEAHAWGLYSHVAYTHSFLNTLPLMPIPWWQVMRRYPSLVMAGACLPDLAVVSRRFRASHGWGIGQQLLHTDNERHLALGIGYNIHLLTDVVAHQHFVPTFEAKWNHDSLLTHAAAEWAMDAYLKQAEIPAPHRLLRLHQK
ncbi:MAG TPA: zinc dependent phospholipase C family protein, partial [Methylophilus sp.]